MADYAIGDVQGCYEPLQRLLDRINFEPFTDRLWFVGDLVNRGPHSLKVLRFIKALPLAPRITLGNHDLYLLAKIFTESAWQNFDDTLACVTAAEDSKALGHWLRNQSILYHDKSLNFVMCHAGIAPLWDLAQAKAYAKELENTLRGDNYMNYLANLYGNEPHCWNDSLSGIPRLRALTNYFTRMRFCTSKGGLNLNYKGTLEKAPSDLIAWYLFPDRKLIHAEIVFGHWAALNGKCNNERIHAIDTGCVWGKKLTAIRLQDRKRFSVRGIQ